MSDDLFKDHFNAAVKEYHSHNLPSALDSLEKALKNKPNNYQAWHLKGLIHKNQGLNTDAIFCYKKSLSLCSDLLKREKLEKILADIEQKHQVQSKKISHVRSLHKSEFDLEKNLETVQNFIDKKKYDDGLSLIDKILEYCISNKNNSGNLYDLDELYVVKGFLCDEIGKTDEAVNCFNAALKCNPNNLDAKNFLQAIFRGRNQIPAFSQQNKSSNSQITRTQNNSQRKIVTSLVKIFILLGAIFIFFSALSSTLDWLNTPNIPNDFSSSPKEFDNSVPIVQQIDPDNSGICKQIVRDFHKTHEYIPGKYVCEDMAIDVWRILDSKGINSIIAIGDPDTVVLNREDTDHAWVLAEVKPNQWLALECTNGETYSQQEKPLYYNGWYFNSADEDLKYRNLFDQYNSINENRNSFVDVFNNADYYTQQSMEGTIDSYDLQLREINSEIERIKSQRLINGQRMGVSNPAPSKPSEISQYPKTVNPVPIDTIQSVTNNADIRFNEIMTNIRNNIPPILTKIRNNANSNDISGMKSSLYELEDITNLYSSEIKNLEISQRYWTYKELIIKGLNAMEKSSNSFQTGIESYYRDDLKTSKEEILQGIGELKTAENFLTKAETEYNRIS